MATFPPNCFFFYNFASQGRRTNDLHNFVHDNQGLFDWIKVPKKGKRKPASLKFTKKKKQTSSKIATIFFPRISSLIELDNS